MTDKGVVKSKTLFDHLNAICKKPDPNYWNTLTDSDKKSWDTFMILKFLSMNHIWTAFIDDLQHTAHSLTNEQCFLLLYDLIPKSNVFLKFISAKSDKKIETTTIDYVSVYYNESRSTAESYVNILHQIPSGSAEINRILNLYGIESPIPKKKHAKR